MADKYITLHPNNNGILDTSIDIYPNIKASQNILDDSGNKIEVQQKLVAGTTIKNLKYGGTTVQLLGSGTIILPLLDLLYPVGSIYMCSTEAIIRKDSSDNPVCPIESTLGGTWTPIYNTFLYAAAKGTHVVDTHDYYPGDSGGSKDLIVPYHTHTMPYSYSGDNVYTKNAIGDTSGTLGLRRKGQDAASLALSYSGIVTKSEGTHSNSYNGIAEGAQREKYDIFTIDISNHKHLVEMPTHKHTINYAGTSGNVIGANMPPYIAVYMWKRTA